MTRSAPAAGAWLLFLAGTLLIPHQATGQGARWRSVYFHDEDHSGLRLHDIQWPGENCWVAAGELSEYRRAGKPVTVISTDAGHTWRIVRQKRWIRHLTFLNPRLGWLLAPDRILRTSDCGATSETAGRLGDTARIFFRDEAFGWAVGLLEKASVTRDGGRTWTAIDKPRPKQPGLFSWVEFATPELGIAVGWTDKNNAPPLSWMSPGDVQFSVEHLATSRFLLTKDGGQTWKALDASLLGRITRLRTSPAGLALLTVELPQSVQHPSDVYLLDLNTTDYRRIHRDPNLFITDAVFGTDGAIYLAGVEVTGSIRLPAVTKVRMLRSRDNGKSWESLPVDYRAAAQRVFLAVNPAGGGITAATDTGMILRLE